MWKDEQTHKNIKTILERQHQRRSFPHAYLFVGPTGVGKRAVAREYAAAILNVEDDGKPEQHPDFVSYDAAQGTGIEGMRDLMTRLTMRPFIGEHKVVLIDNFDAATTQTANALLKTLEEPSSSTVIILISKSRNILPTIVSRCQEFVFNPMNTSPEKKLDDDTLTLMADKLLVIMYIPVADRLLVLNELAELETDQLQELLVGWVVVLRDELAIAPEKFSLILKICEALESLKLSYNKKMVLQHLLIG